MSADGEGEEDKSGGQALQAGDAVSACQPEADRYSRFSKHQYNPL